MRRAPRRMASSWGPSIQAAADEGRRAAAAGKVTVSLEDLHRELARGQENEGAGAFRGLRARRRHALDERDEEAEGLAGAGLRGGENVVAIERGRNRLCLDRSGSDEIGGGNLLLQGGRKGDFRKGVQCVPVLGLAVNPSGSDRTDRLCSSRDPAPVLTTRAAGDAFFPGRSFERAGKSSIVCRNPGRLKNADRDFDLHSTFRLGCAGLESPGRCSLARSHTCDFFGAITLRGLEELREDGLADEGENGSQPNN